MKRTTKAPKGQTPAAPLPKEAAGQILEDIRRDELILRHLFAAGFAAAPCERYKREAAVELVRLHDKLARKYGLFLGSADGSEGGAL